MMKNTVWHHLIGMNLLCLQRNHRLLLLLLWQSQQYQNRAIMIFAWSTTSFGIIRKIWWAPTRCVCFIMPNHTKMQDISAWRVCEIFWLVLREWMSWASNFIQSVWITFVLSLIRAFNSTYMHDFQKTTHTHTPLYLLFVAIVLYFSLKSLCCPDFHMSNYFVFSRRVLTMTIFFSQLIYSHVLLKLWL